MERTLDVAAGSETEIRRSSKFAALIVFTVATVLFAVWPREFPLDDAYITLHNARSLLSGSDPLFGVNPLVGATSSVHLATVAALGLVIPLPSAALAVSVFFSAVYALGLLRLSGGRWSLVVIGMLAGYVPVQLLNGLETSMAMAAITWALALADDKRLPLLLGVMPFIRPDLALVAAPLALRQMRTGPVRVILLASIAAAPWVVWNVAATGSPLPSTAAAKVIFFAEYLNPLSVKILWVGKALTYSFVAPLMIGLAGLPRLRAGWCGLIYVATLIGTALIVFPGSLTHNEFRYLAMLVPVLCYGLVGLPALATRLLVGVSVVTGLLSIHTLYDIMTRRMIVWRDGAAAVVKYIPAGSVVLLHDIGYVAWANPRVRLVDVVGLKTPSSTDIILRHGIRFCRLGQALDEIARKAHATHVVVLQQFFWRCVGDNLRDDGWTMIPMYSQPGGFAIYRITAPQGRGRSATILVTPSFRRSPATYAK